MANVLLIDAEKDFAQGIASAIESWGYACQWFTDGKEGLDKAMSQKPSAIVLCVELPKMSGYSICNKLKKDEALKGIPLIITSREATSETFEQHKKLKTRAEAYLIKPFKPTDLQPLLAQFAPTAAPPDLGDGELESLDLMDKGKGKGAAGGTGEEDIVLDDLPADSKEEAFDPGGLVGDESQEKDPFDALDSLEIAGEEDERQPTRIMKVPPELMAQMAAAQAKPAAPPPKTVAAPVAAPMPAPASASTKYSPVARSAPVTDDERRQLEQKLQEARQKAASSAQEVDKLRAEMNQVRTKAREETASLRTQVQELTEKLKTEQQTLKTRYEESTQKAIKEAATLRQQVKDVQARAQVEMEQLRAQLIEIRNQSQDLLTQKDSDAMGSKQRLAEVEAQLETLKAETARHQKIKERTQKAVDVALQLLQETEDHAAA